MNIDQDRPQLDKMYDISAELQDIGLEDQSQFDVAPPIVTKEIVDDSVHDQLPSVEEHKASQQVGGSSRQFRKISIVVAVAIIVASILIAIGVVIGKDSVENHGSPENVTSNSNPAVSEREEQIIDMVTAMGWTDKYIKWGDATSPQRKAVNWLAHGDPKHMAVDVTEEFMKRYALATLYYAFDGDNWAYDIHWLAIDDACEWKRFFESKDGIPIEVGVSCDDGGHLKEIFLPQMNINGAIPHEIGLLLDLEDIDFFGNQIQGNLPDSMRNLRALEVLILHNNKLTGTLPNWVTSLTNLKTLNLAQNEFRGVLPSGMGAALKSLQTLVLENNVFSGTLDPLAKAHSLISLHLGKNNFDGELPTELLQSWSLLNVLDINDNGLTGRLPGFLFVTDTLHVVDLHGNKFNGPIPHLLGEECTIEFLALHDNLLTGTIGRGLESLTGLAHLDLSENLFNGDIPTTLGMLKTLKYLFLAFNSFNAGPVPVEYATLPHLVDLSLQATNRIGTVPYVFEGLSKLVLFDLSKNSLTGTIPNQFGEMPSLQHLMLKDNNLNGTIPATFQDLKLLNTLLLDHNSLTPSYENVCDPTLPKIKIFTADCVKEEDCSCCTSCCQPKDESCNSDVWFSNVDPIAGNGYVRDSYFFKESDIIFPAPRNVIPNYYKNFSSYYANPP